MNTPANLQWQPAQFWRPDNERLVCTLCPFRCSLRDGQAGLCRVRRRCGTRLQTATFASSVRHLQAIERKPFYHFRPGRNTLTLAAPGCMFRCDYCQNSRISQYGREADVKWSATPVEPADIVNQARDHNALIALSYSEPSLAAELTLALCDCAEASGTDIVWKSNGFVTAEALELVAPALAAVNIDLKAANDKAHRQLTGAPLAPVLESLPEVRKHGVWLEISTPLIPGFNTAPADLYALAEQVYAVGADTPWHLLRFHPDYKFLNAPPTSPALLAQALAIAREVGLRYVYVERALGADGRNTRCPSCGDTVITRDIWALRRNALQNGACPNCAESVPGKW